MDRDCADRHALMAHKLFNSWRAWAIAILMGSLAGCIADPDFSTESDRSRLLAAYEAQAATMSDAQAARERAEIRHISVTTAPDASQNRVSVDLLRASRQTVLSRILHQSGLGHIGSEGRVRGRVTARFVEMPIIDALNLILEETGVTATLQADVVHFGLAQPVSDSGGNPVFESREILLQHLAAEDAVALLQNLFQSDEGIDEGRFSVASVTELNAVFVSGPSDLVAQAVTVIARADRPVAHVIIEALVVDVDTSSVESIALSFADGAAGTFEAMSLIPGQTGGSIVTSFSDLAANSAQVTATIDFLAAQNAAQIVARPYIATRSTQPASIEIVNDQFARVDTSGDDSSIISTDSITAGITMQITPSVTEGNAIRMDVSLEESRFGATAGDIIISKERNSASTSMVVDSGQTIMIGGLNSRYRISERAGLPWLRHVPVLSLFAGEQSALETRRELVVYLTPYIWTPGLSDPRPLPGEPDPIFSKRLSLEGGQE
ncbi:MAG: hypothetical protein NXH72_06800 [Hyphomonadaceae bacterium]|nr:hypothetical protein [Hyphomonadaceae bacterium]